MAAYEQGPEDVLPDFQGPLTLDFVNWLAAGDSIVSATAELIQLDTGLDVATSRIGTVAVTGTQLTQTIGSLTPGREYLLRFLPVTVQGMTDPGQIKVRVGLP